MYRFFGIFEACRAMVDTLTVLYFLLPSVAMWPVSTRRTESRFHRGSICDVQTRLHHACSRKLLGVIGPHRCLQQCDLDLFCVGASVDAADACFLHEACGSVTSCSRSDPAHRYWARHCVYGNWDSASGSCVCRLGCLGPRCDRCPRNCLGLAASGFLPGEYLTIIDPDQDRTNLLKVLCDFYPPNTHNVIIMRNAGGIDFNRTWHQYARGFFKNRMNLWGGLKNWHRLSRAGYNRVTTRLAFRGGVGLFRVYEDIEIGGENDRFSFTVQGHTYKSFYGKLPLSKFSGSPPYFGPCLSDVEANRFSTWDRDDNGEGCPSRVGAGWWFGGCDSQCNLLGWGLDDWNATPTHRKLRIEGVDDMEDRAPNISYVEVYISD